MKTVLLLALLTLSSCHWFKKSVRCVEIEVQCSKPEGCANTYRDVETKQFKAKKECDEII